MIEDYRHPGDFIGPISGYDPEFLNFTDIIVRDLTGKLQLEVPPLTEEEMSEKI